MDHVAALIADGAQRIAEGIQSYRPMADLARDIGRIQLRAHIKLTNRQGYPDLRATSEDAKEVNRRMFDLAQELSGVGGDVIAKVIKAVHNHKSDARSEYLRSLDDPSADVEPYRGILDDAPGVPPSVAVAVFYGASTKGRRDNDREAARQSRRTRVTGTSPQARALSVTRAVSAVLSEAVADDFRALEGEPREKVRRELGNAAETLAAVTEAVQR